MNMTAFQREGLQLLGYNQRESEFLSLVATHSGYFTNRQFKFFAQTDSGSVSHAFIHKLLEQRHASFRAFRSGGRVYHLFARKVYQAIERENLRTRKKHELDYVKTRLVALDFVLANPQHQYLETEAEKLAFFEKESASGRAILPVKLYRARRSAEVTPRYFVDRFPLFRDHASGTLTFTYVDPGAVTLDGFVTHLRAYVGLLQALPKFDFLYIAPTNRFFEDAKSEFEHVLYGARRGGSAVSLLQYFRLRTAWDAKERVASGDVVLLKEAQALYVGERIEALYQKWQSGLVEDTELEQESGRLELRRKAQFRTLLCGSSLIVFTDPLGKHLENWPGGLESHQRRQVSNRLSADLPGG